MDFVVGNATKVGKRIFPVNLLPFFCSIHMGLTDMMGMFKLKAEAN